MNRVTIVDSDRKTITNRSIKIARTLKNYGYEVKFLTWDRTGKQPNTEYVEGFEVHNFRFKPSNNLKILMLSYPFWWIYEFFFLLFNKSNFLHVNNLYSLIPAVPIRIIKREKIVYDILDFVADSLNWPELIKLFLARLENLSLKFVDAVIIVDENRLDQIKSNNLKNLEIIMNCTDDLEGNLKKKLESNQLIIYYGGWISETRGIKQILEATTNLDNVKVIVAGKIKQEKALISLLNSHENVEFLGLINEKESLDWTYTADLLFAFYDPEIPINKLASPNKLFDAMMCSTPILANSEALKMANILSNEKCGLLCPYNDINALKEAISVFKEDSNLRKKMGENARVAFEQKYNWKIMEKRLLSLYNKLG